MTVRRARLPLLFLLEALWGFALVAVVAQVFSQDEGAGPSIIAVAAIVIGSFALSRALQQLDISEGTMRIAGVAATVAALLVVLRLEYMRSWPVWDIAWMRTLAQGSDEYTSADAAVVAGCIAMTGLWLRGILRGQVEDDFDGAARSAFIGLAPVTIAAASQPAVRGTEMFGLLAIGYVVLALLVLALYQAGEPDRRVSALAAQWGGSAAAVVAAAIVLTLLAAAVEPSAFGALAPVGEPLRVAGRTAAQYVLGPPLAALAWLFELLMPAARHQQPQQPDLSQPIEKPPDNGEPALWVRILEYVFVGGIATIAALLVLLFIAFMFRRFAKRRPDLRERREEVEEDRTFGDDLGDLLDALGRRFRRGSHAPPSAIAIRRLYEEMLDRAAADGLSRSPAATPLQFAPQLDAQYGSTLPTDITLAFADSRYGARDIDEGTVRRLRAQWDSIRRG